MLTPEYCVTMARYNCWQNNQLKTLFQTLDDAALTAERGSFFGSILATANHVLWADRVWLARLAGGTAPGLSIGESVALTKSVTDWEIERFRTDGALLLWAEGLGALDLAGPLTWYSGAAGAEMSRPLSQCVIHMFNHQTHHRGQIHAMLTAAGSSAPVSDLAFMPQEGPWL